MSAVIRHDWSREDLLALFDLPFPELLFRAASVHREHFDPTQVQVSTLLSVKTGGCPEDCAYCPQAQRYDTGVDAQKLMDTDAVVERARAAKHAGASRAWVVGSYDEGVVHLEVGDDGQGGADPLGGGLAGIARRLAAFDAMRATALSTPLLAGDHAGFAERVAAELDACGGRMQDGMVR